MASCKNPILACYTLFATPCVLYNHFNSNRLSLVSAANEIISLVSNNAISLADARKGLTVFIKTVVWLAALYRILVHFDDQNFSKLFRRYFIKALPAIRSTISGNLI